LMANGEPGVPLGGTGEAPVSPSLISLIVKMIERRLLD
jgi:hypothetical protein